MSTFSVVSFNILAKRYCRKEAFPQVPEEYLAFNNRLNRMEHLIDELDGDLLCLQEVDFELNLSAYEQIFAKRSRTKQDGCLTCWKRDKFVLIRSEIVEFNDIRMIALEENRVLRDNVALFVELLYKERNLKVIVANTHLYYHPEYEDIRVVQIRYLIQRLENFRDSKGLVVLCGDFNSLPNGSVYNYITKGLVDSSKTEQDLCHEETVKLLLEGDLKKLHKWLRMLGIDATFERTSSKLDYDSLLERARSEHRIVVSRNKRLTERKTCPRYVLVPNYLTHEEALKFVVKRLSLNFSEDTFFSRCIVCNCKVQNLSTEEARKFDDYPWHVEEVEGSEALKFFYCIECKKIYWWGPKSYFTIDDLKKIIHSSDGDEKAWGFSNGFTDETISDKDIRSSHNLNLLSAYAIVFGAEPPFTNYTHTFQGTLDYIFFSAHLNLICENAKPVPENLSSPLPNSDWPSDHLPLKAEFHILDCNDNHTV
jgi:mRNA deadenylase 3'-5' endonuclease subunit Ccr4